MSLKGFIKCNIRLTDESVKNVALELVTYLQANGNLVLKPIDVSSVHGLEWVIEDPEVKRLKDRIEELEDSNSRLYRALNGRRFVE